MNNEIPKVIAIYGGIDWSDAEVGHYINLTNRSAEDIQKEYISVGGYEGTKKGLSAWAIEKKYIRDVLDNEIDHCYEDL